MRAVGSPRRTEVRAAESSDLSLTAAIGVHHPELHAIGAHEPLPEEPKNDEDPIDLGGAIFQSVWEEAAEMRRTGSRSSAATPSIVIR